ncbi:MAG: AMP-binding protein [Myxococcota bacterium]
MKQPAKSLGPLVEGGSLWRLIEARADATPDTSLAVDQLGREISFAEYRDRAERTARGLAAFGLEPGQRVAWMLPTSMESLVLAGALSRLGVVQNPILPIYRARELSFMVKQSRPTLLITPREWQGFDYASMANQIAEPLDHLRTLVVDPTLLESEKGELPEIEVSAAPAEPYPIRWLFYTSGTTAEPKGVQHLDATLLLAAKGMSEALALRESDRVAFVFPVTHVGGIVWLMAALACGSRLILIEHFAAHNTIPALQKAGVTLAAAGTIFHESYLAAARRMADPPLFPKVRAFPGGGASKPAQLHHDLKKEFGGVGILSGYGSTEAPILTMGRVEDPSGKLAGTEGRPALPGINIRVIRDDGSLAKAGEDGEFRVRAPQLFRGYLDASLDREAFDADGYFRTGDRGHLDQDGHLVVTGRLKDIIIRKGENIPAKEVEDLLRRHPKIVDVAVIGLPDSKTGERCCAVVTCDETKEPISFQEMKSFLHEQQLLIQRFPEQLEVIEALPRNATGKVLKQELRDRFRRSGR